MVKRFKTLALVENLGAVLEFLEECLKEANMKIKSRTIMYVACEEIFINISRYAYKGIGEVEILFESDESRVKLTFIDEGVPFDPVKYTNPDVSLSADERQIGGLGIYIVKRTMDELLYLYTDRKNHLTLVKSIN